jgi:hypothetical protein
MAHDPDQAGNDLWIGGQQAAQQRTPGEMDGHPVGKAVQLRGQRLGGGHHEQRVGQATTLWPAGGPPGGRGHRGRAGVDPDDQPVRLGGRGGQHEATVTGPEVDGRRAVAGDQVLESADVHLSEAPAVQRSHRSSLRCCRCWSDGSLVHPARRYSPVPGPGR